MAAGVCDFQHAPNSSPTLRLAPLPYINYAYCKSDHRAYQYPSWGSFSRDTRWDKDWARQ